eukprot:TRINITY_DN5309_c0_g1_i1.p2 TRINITY_DN5309_c0_g1~~TRINITY_DN5309_c0_g1_i1.p2  ORF type:complete len:467 (+),score=223.07 TRINITY_DN5309_c0_g1_i1:112-1512(+)
MKSVFTSGRPPWYSVDDPSNRKRPLVIGVAGGTASGKSTVCKAILERLDVQWVVILPTDSFYRPLTDAERADVGNYDFDHPSAFDWPLLRETLASLKRCERVTIPHYNFVTHSREVELSTTVYGADVIIVEGIMALYDPGVRADLDMRIFVDTDSDLRLCRRLRRDIAERGRDVAGVLAQYERFVKPAFDEFVQPTKQFADIVVPRGAENRVAIDLIATHVANKLRERSEQQPTPRVPRSTSPLLPENVHVLPDKLTTRACVTQLRDSETGRGDFVRFADRLTHQLLELALGLLPMRPASVVTPTGTTFEGCRHAGELCAVSVMRAGDAIVSNLHKVVRAECHYGQLLIQSDAEKKPSLFYVKLPSKEIVETPVLLCDPLIATGASMTMAIRVLLDHGVSQENIFVVTLFASRASISAIKQSFPDVHVCVAAIEEELNEEGYLLPGVGQFTNRYFGTLDEMSVENK